MSEKSFKKSCLKICSLAGLYGLGSWLWYSSIIGYQNFVKYGKYKAILDFNAFGEGHLETFIIFPLILAMGLYFIVLEARETRKIRNG